MSLFTIPKLEVVNLKGNQFKGPIEFGNTSSLSSLWYLRLAQNKFHGPIPESISLFRNLREVDLSHNNFIVPIPTSISKLAKLEFLDLSHNNLEGKLPGYLWGMTMVMLSHNSFSSFGKSPKGLSGTRLRALGIGSNSFQGPFPDSICKLKSLRFLDLSNNSFSGSIPPCLENFTASLQEQILHNNKFNGPLPDVFVNATKFLSLDVSNNQLEGKLPKSLIKCSSIQLLNVERNKIKDEFPSWLGSLLFLGLVK